MSFFNFASWDDAIHNTSDQQKRLSSAKKSDVTPSSVDKESAAGIFPGSGASPYRTTLDSCTCVDFIRRKMPCKHIYRLAMECGLIDADFQSGKNKNITKAEGAPLREVIAELENLTDDEQIAVKNFLLEHIYHGAEVCAFDFPNNATIYNSKLLERVYPSAGPYLQNVLMSDIKKMLDSIGISHKGIRKRVDIIALCDANSEKVIPLAPQKKFYAFSNYVGSKKKLYTYLNRKYDWEYFFGADLTEYKYPHGSKPDDFVDPWVYDFPDDEITRLLTLYGHNRCLGGYDPRK